MRCQYCGGSKEVLGPGMMNMIACPQCDGIGERQDTKIDYKAAKNTKAYQKARTRLKMKTPGLSDEEVEKILDEELRKEIGE